MQDTEIVFQALVNSCFLLHEVTAVFLRLKNYILNSPVQSDKILACLSVKCVVWLISTMLL